MPAAVSPGDVDRDAADALLPIRLPARPRALAILDGVLSGAAWTDDPARPTWIVLIDGGDGTVYCGGALTGDALRAVLAQARTTSGDLIFGFTGPDDPVRAILPADPSYVGRAIDFTERGADADEEILARPIPDGLSLVDLDAALLARTEWAEDTLEAFGSVEAWTALGIGRCLVDRDGGVIAQGMAGPRVGDEMEMGVWTRADHRRRGLGTLVSLRTAIACEAAGARVWWNTNADNVASIGIARRIGFRRERVYDLVAYRTTA
jgi:RimJ/RimL family protein N-acetyltransferase